MKRLLVSLDDERYEDLRRLAFEKKAPMAELVRYAIEKVFDDDLDAMTAQRGLEHYMKNPGDYISIDYLHRRECESRSSSLQSGRRT